MINDHTKTKIDKNYVGVFVIAVFSTWVLHEFSHWTIGEYLGYKMGMTLNSGYPLLGKYSKDSHYQIISSVGPIVTLFEALLVYILMLQRKRTLLYPFIFVCFYMLLFATIISFRNPNDEARVSIAIGVGKFTLPIIMTLILFLMLYKISIAYQYDAKFNLANLGLTIMFSSLLILTDMYFEVRIL